MAIQKLPRVTDLSGGDLIPLQSGALSADAAVSLSTIAAFIRAQSPVTQRETAAAWLVLGSVLADGQIGIETDTGYAKIGDGFSSWANLPYLVSGPSTVPPPTPLPAQPLNTLMPVITGIAQSGQLLYASTGSWTNSPTAFAYQWVRGASDIPTATNQTYLLQGADVGSALFVRVVATNAGGSGVANSAATTTVQPAINPPAPPVNTALPTITGTAQESETLTGTPGSWTNSPTAFAYQWRRGAASISGATAITYVVKAADIGSAISLRVTASNAGGPGAAATSVATAAVIAAGGGGGGVDTRPRFGSGIATAGVDTPAALLTSMVAMASSSNGGTVGSFTSAPAAGQYGWAAFVASASVSGVTFTDALGTGGWQGASSPGNNGGDDGSSPNTSVVTYDDGTNVWRFFRQSYADAGGAFTCA